MVEEWKDMFGYEEYFKVSNMGNILSKKTNIILKQNLQNYRYLGIVSRLNGRKSKAHAIKTHRVVALTFLSESYQDGLIVNHIDGNKLNNRVDNLEWVTHKENSKHASEMGLYKNPKGQDSHLSKLKNEDVLEIRRLYNTKKKYTHEYFSDVYGVSKSNIMKIINRVTWKHI